MPEPLLLPTALAHDPNSQIVASLLQRYDHLDRSRVLVYLIDTVGEDVLPYLAEQFNLSGLLWNHLPDTPAQRRFLKQAVNWHRQRGSPWALQQVFAAWGQAVTVEDLSSSASRWTEYQLAFDSIEALSTLELMLELARCAAPARAHLVRVYADYDLRPIGLSQAAALDQGLLSDDSGVWQDPLKVSFGRVHPSTLDTQHSLTLQGARHDCYSERTWYNGATRLNLWRLDSTLTLNHPLALSQWIASANAMGLVAPARLIQARHIAQTAIVLSDTTTALGHENARFGGAWRQADNLCTLSLTRLSGYQTGIAQSALETVSLGAYVGRLAATLDDRIEQGASASYSECFSAAGPSAYWYGNWGTQRWSSPRISAQRSDIPN